MISNCGTATEGLSEFVDLYIQPVVKNLPDIIKDTIDFLCRLKDLVIFQIMSPYVPWM